MNEALGRRIPATVWITTCTECGGDLVIIVPHPFSTPLEIHDRCMTPEQRSWQKFNRAKPRKEPKSGRKRGWKWKEMYKNTH